MCQESSLIFRTGTKIPSQGTKKKKNKHTNYSSFKESCRFLSHFKQLFLHRAVHPVLWECYYISI